MGGQLEHRSHRQAKRRAQPRGAASPAVAVPGRTTSLGESGHFELGATVRENFTGPIDFCMIQPMEHRISAAELLRRLDEILGKVHSRGDSFVVERNGDPVARIVPLPEKSPSFLRRGLARCRPTRPGLCRRSGTGRRAADRPAENAWA
jgi:antitoxin (DNA-binding transcriptional repressor) of toxin-antitoxin stability system